MPCVSHSRVYAVSANSMTVIPKSGSRRGPGLPGNKQVIPNVTMATKMTGQEETIKGGPRELGLWRTSLNE